MEAIHIDLILMPVVIGDLDFVVVHREVHGGWPCMGGSLAEGEFVHEHIVTRDSPTICPLAHTSGVGAVTSRVRPRPRGQSGVLASAGNAGGC